ncbi:MAG: efflux RND transporter permease subunit, partial [bacterium]
MNISDVAIRRPVFIAMVVMAVVVLGLFAVMRLPVELFPKIDIPYVTVVTIYPGASPEEIETLITDKLEDELSAISDLKSMTSESQENFSMIALEFKVEASLDAKAADVRDKVNSIKYLLPDDAEDPIVYKLDLDSFPIMFFSVSSTRPPIEVRKTAEDIIKKKMEQIPGVATVAILGGREREIQIDVDRNRLASKNLNILQVVEALRKDNLNVPVGKLKKGTEESLVRVIGEFTTVEEIGAVEIPTPMGNVRIRDIAEVKDSYKDIDHYARLMGKNAVSLSVQKQSGANTAAVSFAAVKELEKLDKSLPDYNVSLVSDLSSFIKDAVKDVRTNLFYGALFATIMIILFLRDGRSSFIIFLAIPTAIISTFMPIYSVGFTINFMSLMGLAIAVGTLVDNSTVVLENIYRHLEMGKSPPEAAHDGVREVGLAVMASGLTNICVYLPVAFMSGMVGQFFKEFGFTVAFATAFSIFIAFTLTPSLGARILKAKIDKNGNKREPSKASPGVVFPGLIIIGLILYFGLGKAIPAINEGALAAGGGVGMLAVFAEIVIGVLLAIPAFKMVIFPAFDAGYAVVERNYPKVLEFALRRRAVVMGMVTALFLVSVFITTRLGFEFVGQGDTGEFQVMVEMPPYASLDDTDAVIRKVEKMIEKIPELEVMSSAVGARETGTGTQSSDPGYGYVKAKLVPFKKRKRSTDEVMQSLRTQVADIPDAIFQISQASMGGP